MTANPLRVPELLTQCIGHLRADSTPDLPHCALVARAWVYPAQAHLFRALIFVGRGFYKPQSLNWAQFQKIIGTSPHLIQHVRQLTIFFGRVDIGTLSELSDFRFTHLENLDSRYYDDSSLQYVLAHQKLLSLDTLRSVKLKVEGSLPEPEIFLKIWDSCRSPLLKRLELELGGPLPLSASSALPITSRAAPVALNVLRMTGGGIIDIRLASMFYAWNLTSLKALWLDGSFIVAWMEIPLLIPAIEVLSIILRSSDIDLDLSSFPNLSVLRVHVHHRLETTRDIFRHILSTIAPSSHIHTFMFSFLRLDPLIAAEVDSILSTLTLEHTHKVEVELYPRDLSTVPVHFPGLTARNMLHYGNQNYSWWENMIDTL
ncbi:hypothetical protein C8F04DRAFT_1104343 [Mycena alexandri]|uniref:Uncharacterized protein n=1 Tax=Mycena alexandri TaxID=1745969 RepID=A0AAD6STT0_9AGAR|nr:hypothetical protein C8F04DRAFT_1104343 [Mycena alexandri]